MNNENERKKNTSKCMNKYSSERLSKPLLAIKLLNMETLV